MTHEELMKLNEEFGAALAADPASADVDHEKIAGMVSNAAACLQIVAAQSPEGLVVVELCKRVMGEYVRARLEIRRLMKVN